MEFARRAARNEEISREANRRLEEGADVARDGRLEVHCECGQTLCFETIELPAEDYERVLEERFRFVVVPDHVVGGVERVVEEHDEYVVVEKVGEARKQIERDHPQQRHGRPDTDA